MGSIQEKAEKMKNSTISSTTRLKPAMMLTMFVK